MAPDRDPDRIARCLAASAHIRTLVGTMQQRGVRVAIGQAETEHGIPFSVVVAQGAVETEFLQAVARMVAERLEADRQADIDKARGN